MKLLIDRILNGGDPADPDCRRRAGALAGRLGILLNLLLFGGKLAAGLVTSSVAIIGDAVNNLSDAAGSVITLAGFRLSGMAPDAHHPFGHGRFEYIAGLIVALAILVMGVEVGQSSLRSLFHHDTTDFSPLSLAILGAAIAVKLWMFFFNRTLGRRISSAAMEAAAADSLSDTAATSVVLLSTLVSRFWGVQVDGLAGLLVAVFILKAGWDSLWDTLDPLLGRPMDPDLADDIDRLVLSHKYILGIHDLVYHDYGPGRAMMSFHAEVPAEEDFVTLHEQIDHIERELKERHHIETVIHMDPVVRDARTEALRAQTADLAREVDPALTIHDFRVVPGSDGESLIFDVVLPYESPLTSEQVRLRLSEKLRDVDPMFRPIIEVDHSFVEHRPVP